MKKLTAICAVVLAMSAGACAVPERSRETANPATPPRALATQVCSNCHGIAGIAASPNFPNLAAQQEGYLIAQMKGFRGQARSDPAGFEYMWGLSKHLTDEQISGLAAYYAGQPGAALPIGDAKAASAGKDIFENGLVAKSVPACTSCHGPQGQGTVDFPRLAGQHSDYVEKQLMVFQRTDQRPEGAVMKVIAHGLSRDDMRAVAAYVQGIPPK